MLILRILLGSMAIIFAFSRTNFQLDRVLRTDQRSVGSTNLLEKDWIKRRRLGLFGQASSDRLIRSAFWLRQADLMKLKWRGAPNAGSLGPRYGNKFPPLVLRDPGGAVPHTPPSRPSVEAYVGSSRLSGAEIVRSLLRSSATSEGQLRSKLALPRCSLGFATSRSPTRNCGANSGRLTLFGRSSARNPSLPSSTSWLRSVDGFLRLGPPFRVLRTIRGASPPEPPELRQLRCLRRFSYESLYGIEARRAFGLLLARSLRSLSWGTQVPQTPPEHLTEGQVRPAGQIGSANLGLWPKAVRPCRPQVPTTCWWVRLAPNERSPEGRFAPQARRRRSLPDPVRTVLALGAEGACTPFGELLLSPPSPNCLA